MGLPTELKDEKGQTNRLVIGKANGLFPYDGTTEELPEPKTVIEEFNEFFHDRASARIHGGYLLITIGNRTMWVQLPGMVGGESTGL